MIGLLLGLAVLQTMRPGLLAIALVLGLALLVGVVIRIGNTPNSRSRCPRCSCSAAPTPPATA